MDFQFTDLTLENAAQGKAEELFQEALGEVVETLHERHRMQSDTEGWFSTKVVLEFDFRANTDPENDAKTLTVTAHVKRPKRRSVACAVHEDKGRLLTQPRLEQGALFQRREKTAQPKGDHQ